MGRLARLAARERRSEVAPVRSVVLVSIGLWVLLLVAAPAALAQSGAPGGYVDGEIVLGVAYAARPAAVDRALASAGVAVVHESLPAGVLLVRAPVGREDAAVEHLRTTGLFTNVQRNLLQIAPPPVVARRGAAFIPDDARFGEQWNLATVRAAAAWDVTRGSPSVRVCVVDSGYAVGHVDQPANFVAGRDLVSSGSVVGDPHGHGTHVAGIVAARQDNGEGISGLGPGLTVVPVRVLAGNGFTVGESLANGIHHAADVGCRVINLSIVGGYDPASDEAVIYAQSKGALVVASAGNCARVAPRCPPGNPVIFPAALPGVLAVAATEAGDGWAPYSTHRPYVGVAAPGSEVLSSLPGLVDGRHARYGLASGTSMAAPHVAALAGMIWSIHPGLSAGAVADVIQRTAVDLLTPGRDDYVGSGRIDAYAGVRLAQRLTTPTRTRVVRSPVPTATRTPTPTPTVTPTPPPPTATPSPTPTATLVATVGAVGPEGGFVGTEDGRLWVSVPAGAVAGASLLAVESRAPRPRWDGWQAIAAFAVTLDGRAVTAGAGREVMVRYRYERAALGMVDEATLALFRVEGRRRVRLPGTLDPWAGTVSGSAGHLSEIEVAGLDRATATPTAAMPPPAWPFRLRLPVADLIE
jgi:subtilisin family serine protease